MSDWKLSASFVIADAGRILLLEGDTGWHLPSMKVPSFVFNLDQVHHDLQKTYQADMTLLRVIQQSYNEAEKSGHAWWLMENHTADWSLPENSRWFDAAAIETVDLANEADRAILLDTLASFDQVDPDLRPMFMKPGWFAEMRDWISSTLTKQGYTVLSPPVQLKQFILTAIIRAETDQGMLYAKVANPHYPLFCNEAHTTQSLATLFPENIPMPLAIHANGMALFSDFGKVLWEREMTEADYVTIVETYAKLQIQTSSQLEDLEKAGCINRRLDVLTESINDLMVDNGTYDLLDDDLRQKWLMCGDKLISLCEQLATYNLPHSLVHGDFHGGNVAMNAGKITFFDWTDACIAHPFFDVTTMIEFSAEHKEAMQDAFLKCWLDYEPIERLQEAYELAYVLSAVHQLLSYYSIRQHSEASYQSDFDWSIPRFVGVIVEKLKALEKSS